MIHKSEEKKGSLFDGFFARICASISGFFMKLCDAELSK